MLHPQPETLTKSLKYRIIEIRLFRCANDPKRLKTVAFFLRDRFLPGITPENAHRVFFLMRSCTRGVGDVGATKLLLLDLRGAKKRTNLKLLQALLWGTKCEYGYIVELQVANIFGKVSRLLLITTHYNVLSDRADAKSYWRKVFFHEYFQLINKCDNYRNHSVKIIFDPNFLSIFSADEVGDAVVRKWCF